MEWWQVVSAVVGLVGGTIGILTFLFGLAEKHQPPKVTLEKIEGDGWAVFIVEVSNAGLVPSTVVEAGLAFGSMRNEELVFDEMKCALKMTPPGEPYEGKPYLVKERERAFVLPSRSIVRAGIQQSLIADTASSCRASPIGGTYEIRGYCLAAHPGLYRKPLRLSKDKRVVDTGDARPH